MAKIDSVDELRRRYKQPMERAVKKQLDRLDPHCRHFIDLAPIVLLATVGEDGLADVSPKGDAPGFVQVLDDTTLAIPDRPGNNRLDTLTNLMTNPAVGLIFLVPGVDETLRVNGLAEVRDDEHLRQRFAVQGRLPATVIRVQVKEAYLHCAKALMRSKLWDPATRVERSVMPSMGQMLKDQIGSSAPAETQAEMLERYKTQMY